MKYINVCVLLFNVMMKAIIINIINVCNINNVW